MLPEQESLAGSRRKIEFSLYEKIEASCIQHGSGAHDLLRSESGDLLGMMRDKIHWIRQH
jgi:hypothetical protein